MALPTAPTTITTGIGSVPSIYFDRVAIKALNANVSLYGALDFKNMPLNSGSVVQIYANMAAASPTAVNTTPPTQGVMGAGTAFVQPVKSLTLAQYVDYMTFSDKLVTTGLPGLLEDAAVTLGRRGSLVVDTIIANALNTAAAADSTATVTNADSVYFTAAVSRKLSATLAGKNVERRSNGKFYGVIGSQLRYDLTNDATAGGFIDLSKYNESTVKVLQDGVSAGNLIGVIDGTEWYESNAFAVDAAYAPAGALSPPLTKNGYTGYIVGDGAIWGASIGTNALGQKNFSVNVERNFGPNQIDIARQTAAGIWYKIFFGCVTRPGTVNGFIRFNSESTLG